MNIRSPTTFNWMFNINEELHYLSLLFFCPVLSNIGYLYNLNILILISIINNILSSFPSQLIYRFGSSCILLPDDPWTGSFIVLFFLYQPSFRSLPQSEDGNQIFHPPSSSLFLQGGEPYLCPYFSFDGRLYPLYKPPVLHKIIPVKPMCYVPSAVLHSMPGPLNLFPSKVQSDYTDFEVDSKINLIVFPL